MSSKLSKQDDSKMILIDIAQVLGNHLEDKAFPGKVWLGEVILIVCTGPLNSTQPISCKK